VDWSLIGWLTVRLSCCVYSKFTLRLQFARSFSTGDIPLDPALLHRKRAGLSPWRTRVRSRLLASVCLCLAVAPCGHRHSRHCLYRNWRATTKS